MILGLHVSIVLNHLQALVFYIHTKNALRIVGSPTLTITEAKYKNSKQYRICVCGTIWVKWNTKYRTAVTIPTPYSTDSRPTTPPATRHAHVVI